MPLSRVFPVVVAAGMWVAVGCAPPDEGRIPGDEPGLLEALGPHDGRDLPPVDTGRVGLHDIAPDFSMVSWRGDVVSLSDYRGRKDVVLVFYRGHW